MIKRPATLVTSARVSITTLAELHDYWQRQGEDILTLSELVRTSIEGLRVILEMNDMLNPIKGLSEARGYLLSQGLGSKALREVTGKSKNIYFNQLKIEQDIHKKEINIGEDFDDQVLQASLALQQLQSKREGEKKVQEIEDSGTFSNTGSEGDKMDVLLGSTPLTPNEEE